MRMLHADTRADIFFIEIQYKQRGDVYENK